MLARLRSRLARILGVASPERRAAPGWTPALRSEMEAFAALVRRLDRRPASAGQDEDPARWQPDLTRVKAQRHRTLAALAQASSLAEADGRQVQHCLLQGWHLVFQAYATATGILPEDGESDPRIRREDLRQAYRKSCEALGISWED